MNFRGGKFDCVMKIIGWSTKAANSLQSPFLLLIRLYWGWQFFQTGSGKLKNIDHVAQFFQSLRIPLPGTNAWIVSIVEAVGGLLLLLGLGARITALVLAFDMIIAYVTADRDALLSVFSNSSDFVQATPFSFLLASLTVLVFGAGRYSADYLIGRCLSKKGGGKQDTP